jgi:1-acyl-sn-glycerol-3-phosphate acyltransferase
MRERTCVAAALDVFGPVGENGTFRSFRRECLQIVVAAGFHAFAFDRSGPPLRSLRTAVDLIRGGWNLLLYPEGTRSRTGALGPFKAGVGVLAKMTGRPVVPIHVAGGTSILPCGATIPRKGRAHVRYGDPMRLRLGEDTGDFAARVREHVRELGGAIAGGDAAEAACTADAACRVSAASATGRAAAFAPLPEATGDAPQRAR